jgi:hypothetical protein
METIRISRALLRVCLICRGVAWLGGGKDSNYGGDSTVSTLRLQQPATPAPQATQEESVSRPWHVPRPVALP